MKIGRTFHRGIAAMTAATLGLSGSSMVAALLVSGVLIRLRAFPIWFSMGIPESVVAMIAAMPRPNTTPAVIAGLSTASLWLARVYEKHWNYWMLVFASS
ncbi:MAG: hypothetical protein ABSH39_05935 [Candidatus Acidiferrum sp.]